MSQERGASEHYERYLPATKAGVSLALESGTPLPNPANLSYNDPHGFFTASAPASSLFPPSLPLLHGLEALYPYLPVLPSYSLPPIGQFSTKLPSWSQKKSMIAELVDDDDQVQKARAEAKAAKAQQSARKTPTLDKCQPARRRSRLPSNKGPRKLPLSADNRAYPDSSRRNLPAQCSTENSIPTPRRLTQRNTPGTVPVPLAPPVNASPDVLAQGSSSSNKRKLGPQYDYSVPEKLYGVRRALGEDNWNEYLALMEDLFMRDITGVEFAAGTKRICMFQDDRIRKKMNSLMARQIVMPRLEVPDRGDERMDEVETALSN